MTNLTPEQRRELDAIIKDGCIQLEKIKALREGLNETIKAFAEKIDVKPKHVRKAVTIAHKDNYHEVSDDNDIVETLLHNTGRNIDVE